MAGSGGLRRNLTDLACRNAKSGEKPFKLYDMNGLYLYVSPNGHKGWRFKYRYGGKEKLLTFGTYPELGLSKARDMRDDARKLLRDGIDPGAERRIKRDRVRLGVDPASSFKTVAAKWFSIASPQWKERHANDVWHSLDSWVFPEIGGKAIAEVRPGDVRLLCQKVQERGAIETAHRIRQRISAIFAYAIAEELVEIDPSVSIRAALRPVVKKRQPALVRLADAQAFLHAYEQTPGYPATKLASRLLALTAVRPGVIHIAELHEFEDLDGPKPIWRIPASKMKLEKSLSEMEAMEFIVPLSRQAVATVIAARHFSLRRRYLFPSPRHSHRALTDNALNVAYRRVQGFEGKHVPHGWRASFATIMNERAINHGRAADRAIIDLMLAHVQSGVEPLYNRAAYMDRRREIAQEWADLLLDPRFCDPLTFLPSRRR